jgi:hypothetical protein
MLAKQKKKLFLTGRKRERKCVVDSYIKTAINVSYLSLQ